MDTELFADLERRIESLIERYSSLKVEADRLREENGRLLLERDSVKTRVDDILRKLEGI